MNILITGAAGFIGLQLVLSLSKQGEANIIALDKNSPPKENYLKNVRWIKTNTQSILELEKYKIDVIYHLGEYARVERSFLDIDTVIQDNIIGTSQVVRLWLRNKAKLIYAGSSTKFADNGAGIAGSPYALSKGNNTSLIKSIGDWYNLKYAITYFYNVYGEGEISVGPRATVIGIFKECMRQNIELPVRLPGTQIRNFTHVDDIVEGLKLVGMYGSGDDYGIGADTGFSIIEVAKMFGGEIRYITEQRGNRTSGPVITEKTKALGWAQSKYLPDYIEDLRVNNWLEN